MRTISCIFFIVLSFHVNAQWLRASDTVLVDQSGKEVILRGIGLGGWMLQEPYMLQLNGIATAQYQVRSKIEALIGPEQTQAFYTAWLKNHCTKADIDSLAAWGFNSVRLPMHYNLFTLPVQKEPIKGKDTWLQTGFELTDSLLSWCKANRMYLILDLHATPGGQGNDLPIADRDTTYPALWQSDLNQQKTIALWTKLAQRYANEEWIGGYDLINEPNWGFQNPGDKNGCAETLNDPLVALLKKITASIRAVDKKHLVIVEGNCWGNNYNGMLPLFDKNMAISFHKYWNNNDQHAIQKYLDYRSKYRVPIWLGESGENSNAWFTDAIRLCEQHKIGWAWWPLKKMGINNPLRIKPNEGYERLLEYWRGKGEKPSKEEVIQTLQQLAADVNIRNNAVRRDVIDAMMRQVHSTATVPYGRNTLQTHTVLFATDYDFGNQGTAYYDKDSGNYWVSSNRRTEWNKGHQYRNDGVDIQECRDSLTNGYQVAWIEEGEWLKYSVYSDHAGVYKLSLRYSGEKNGQVKCTVNENQQGHLMLPATGSFSTYKNSGIVKLSLNKGWNSVKLLFIQPGFNLNYLQLEK